MPFLYAMDFINVLKKKHAAKGYKEMVSSSFSKSAFSLAHHFLLLVIRWGAISLACTQVIYVEACESGSVFEGIMPKDLDIYVMTASNAQESSFGTYCPGMEPSPPPEYVTCLGDLYSVAWMEDRLVSLVFWSVVFS